jgi:DNA ligase 1
MKAFADLLDRLSYAPARTAKLRLIAAYLRAVPDPDRGWALAALTDGLPFSFPVRRLLTDLVTSHVDPELYRLSRDYVGDTAETVALLWPDRPAVGSVELRLATVIDALVKARSADVSPLIAGWLDALDVTGRWALLKLLTGGLRVGVSARLAKTALAAIGDQDVAEIEEVWHAVEPPYSDVFVWLEHRSVRPSLDGRPIYRPMMLAHPIEDTELTALDLGQYQTEWKWDGIRIQIASARGGLKLFSRTGDDISAAFPDLTGAFAASLPPGPGQDSVLDGELLVLRGQDVAPFNDLQQRLNRKVVTKKQLETHPAHVRLYDALVLEGQDLRARSLDARREALEAWHARVRPGRTSLSEVLMVTSHAELQRIWRDTRANGIEGLMLKRRDSIYVAGRPKGDWWKLKRAALTIDCVLMYAQRGSGKRSSYYSDYTFGAWTGHAGTEPDLAGDRQLVPVGKAYSGFTDEELLALDRWIRAHTTERFGPVLAVEPGLVLEIAFDAVQRSPRHKSGVAMRFPRIHRIRWDKPAAEADRLETLVGMIGG